MEHPVIRKPVIHRVKLRDVPAKHIAVLCGAALTAQVLASGFTGAPLCAECDKLLDSSREVQNSLTELEDAIDETRHKRHMAVCLENGHTVVLEWEDIPSNERA